jgi:hypothetical protein
MEVRGVGVERIDEGSVAMADDIGRKQRSIIHPSLGSIFPFFQSGWAVVGVAGADGRKIVLSVGGGDGRKEMVRYGGDGEAMVRHGWRKEPY